MKVLSIIIPCYNEKHTICRLLTRVADCDPGFALKKEIIVVDDASTDGTANLIRQFGNHYPKLNLVVVTHPQNKGKGAAIRTGIKKASGEIIIIQDADLEYDPADYHKLAKPIIEGYADAVYGSRFIGDGPHRVLFFLHTVGNKMLTFLSNMFTKLNLTDMETGFKMFRAEIIKNVRIKENRFGFEPEVTARISRIKGIRIYEVGVAYHGRTYKEGKKITWKDGFRAIYCIIKYNLYDRS